MAGVAEGSESANFSDLGAVKVALAALVKMVSLLGAEMLVGKYREDIDLFEGCVRAKLFANVEGVSAQGTAAGVALAHTLIEPVLANLRERARAVQASENVAMLAPAPMATRRLN